MKIAQWIDEYSNCGTKIKTASIKAELASLQARYPERKYELILSGRKWYLAENEDSYEGGCMNCTFVTDNREELGDHSCKEKGE